jgi:hypothetical protein
VIHCGCNISHIRACLASCISAFLHLRNWCRWRDVLPGGNLCLTFPRHASSSEVADILQVLNMEQTCDVTYASSCACPPLLSTELLSCTGGCIYKRPWLSPCNRSTPCSHLTLPSGCLLLVAFFCAAVCAFYASYTSFYSDQNTNLATPLGQRVSTQPQISGGNHRRCCTLSTSSA